MFHLVIRLRSQFRHQYRMRFFAFQLAELVTVTVTVTDVVAASRLAQGLLERLGLHRHGRRTELLVPIAQRRLQARERTGEDAVGGGVVVGSRIAHVSGMSGMLVARFRVLWVLQAGICRSSVTLEYPKFYDRYDVFIICPSTGCGSSMEEPGRAVFLATPIGAGLYTSIDF